MQVVACSDQVYNVRDISGLRVSKGWKPLPWSLKKNQNQNQKKNKKKKKDQEDHIEHTITEVSLGERDRHAQITRQTDRKTDSHEDKQ